MFDRPDTDAHDNEPKTGSIQHSPMILVLVAKKRRIMTHTQCSFELASPQAGLVVLHWHSHVCNGNLSLAATEIVDVKQNHAGIHYLDLEPLR